MACRLSRSCLPSSPPCPAEPPPARSPGGGDSGSWACSEGTGEIRVAPGSRLRPVKKVPPDGHCL